MLLLIKCKTEHQVGEKKPEHQVGQTEHREGFFPCGSWLRTVRRTTQKKTWIGQGFKLKKGDGGACIYKKIGDRSERINGSEYTRGDYAVAVKWWVKTSDDPEERTYEAEVPSAEDIQAYGMEQDDDTFFLVNSTELRMVGFQMDPIDPPPRPTAHVSHRTRGASSAPECASTEGRRFRLPADVENQGLAMCW